MLLYRTQTNIPQYTTVSSYNEGSVMSSAYKSLLLHLGMESLKLSGHHKIKCSPPDLTRLDLAVAEQNMGCSFLRL